jgi:hypothetical protein
MEVRYGYQKESHEKDHCKEARSKEEGSTEEKEGNNETQEGNDEAQEGHTEEEGRSEA